ncbi:PQQ-binding-like beta-propeller repeat protein [bacterium]|nr:PQQ-binding-like beta-propeller repeat protein [bacterium]
MNGTRRTALALMIVTALFSIAVVAQLVFAHHRELKTGVLVNAEIAKLKAQLATQTDPSLITSIRGLDQQLRNQYFAARRQNEIAGFMLAAAIVGFVLSARWFFDQAPRTPKRNARLTEADQNAAARRAAVGVALSAIMLFGGLGYLGIGKLSPFKQNWPNLRGPGNLGVAPAGQWPTAWNAASNSHIAWKTAIPSPGKSSPVVWGDRIFLTGGDKAVHRVMCFDRADGALLWDKSIDAQPGAAGMTVAEEAGYAPSTGATDGRNFFAIFADGTVAAFDFDGNQSWLKPLGIPDNQYGHAASLICYEGTLIIQLDQGSSPDEKKSRLIGLDCATGNERWSTPRDLPASWSSPSIIKTKTRAELITCAMPYVVSYDPATGKELWRAKGLSGDIVPSPAFDGERVIVTVNRTFGIRPGGSGDVTKSNIAWRNSIAVTDISSPAASANRTVIAQTGGTVMLLNSADGKQIWENTYDCQITASPIIAGQNIYIFGQDGITRVIRLADTFEQLSQGNVGEPILITPAFADNQIYIRGDKTLFCIK